MKLSTACGEGLHVRDTQTFSCPRVIWWDQLIASLQILDLVPESDQDKVKPNEATFCHLAAKKLSETYQKSMDSNLQTLNSNLQTLNLNLQTLNSYQKSMGSHPRTQSCRIKYTNLHHLTLKCQEHCKRSVFFLAWCCSSLDVVSFLSAYKKTPCFESPHSSRWCLR